MDTPGIAIISNMPAYPMRINPCHSADPIAPDLVTRFISARTSVHCGIRFGMMRLRLSPKPKNSFKNSEMVLQALDTDCPVQVDGECPSHIDGLKEGFLKLGSQIIFKTGSYTLPMHAQ